MPRPQGLLVIVMMAGLPGTGKSTLAVAVRVGGVVLDKDVIRASIFPRRLIEYSTQQDDFVVELMLSVTGYLLRRNPAAIVILDGRPFGKKYQVDMVVAFAQRMATSWRIVECVCAKKVAMKRLQADVAARRHVAGNRNVALHGEVKAGFQKIRRRKLVVRTTLKLETCLKKVEEYFKNL